MCHLLGRISEILLQIVLQGMMEKGVTYKAYLSTQTLGSFHEGFQRDTVHTYQHCNTQALQLIASYRMLSYPDFTIFDVPKFWQADV